MIALGIDPGADGAFVAVDDGRIVAHLDMPMIQTTSTAKTKAGNHKVKRTLDGYAVARWLVNLGEVGTVAIEHVGVMPGQGAVSAFTFGHGVGTVQGILIALGLPWTTVRPQAWTRALGVGPDKGTHRQEAMRLYPQSAALFARVRDDGRADGALIAHYAARMRSEGVA